LPKITVLIKTSAIRNETEFFEMLFPKVPWYATKALEIFNLAKQGKLSKSSYKDVPEQLGLRVPQYYTIVNKLRSLGVLEKLEDKIRPSRTFLSNLARMYKYYKELLESEVIQEEKA